MYRERPSAFAGAGLWTTTADDPAAPEDGVVLPDGCVDLLWLGGDLVVAGPDTRPQTSDGVPGPVTGLRFGSGLLPCLLGVPAGTLRDRRVPLDELWPSGTVHRRRDRMARDPGCFETVALGLLADRTADPAMPRVAAWCRAGLSNRAIVARTGWSERTLHRRALAAFGYGTRTLTRILRFQQALSGLRAGDSLAGIASAAGYADQPHLTREVRALTGRTPTALRTTP
ncbi:AraC-like DNA-binding protein [Friedmanniella endophytica]|uniref:AraC-like DNA-binding protein n=1 Tax=Microlunatus kandeliicorticis TaxID=1759536 RepID=A0A7W3IVP5_9ACTN|nr:helix-turn-helix domain-containing protein [Microlunatus kandeliicorticis]MBA8796114.1 AraC-like DNA-binding protein [Microlunatus kandeliicorticis]